MIQSGGFLGRLLGSLKTGFLLMKNVLKPLAKSVLTLLGLTASSSAIDANISKKMFGLGMATQITSNEEMKDIMEIVKLLEESRLLLKQMKQNNKKEDFL